MKQPRGQIQYRPAAPIPVLLKANDCRSRLGRNDDVRCHLFDARCDALVSNSNLRKGCVLHSGLDLSTKGVGISFLVAAEIIAKA
jgi:hypothetical protein